MNRDTLVTHLMDQLGLSRPEARGVVRELFSAMSEELERGGRVELRGFGTFKVEERKARPARNPRTGETVWLEDRLVPVFRPASELKQRIEQSRYR